MPGGDRLRSTETRRSQRRSKTVPESHSSSMRKRRIDRTIGGLSAFSYIV